VRPREPSSAAPPASSGARCLSMNYWRAGYVLEHRMRRLLPLEVSRSPSRSSATFLDVPLSVLTTPAGAPRHEHQQPVRHVFPQYLRVGPVDPNSCGHHVSSTPARFLRLHVRLPRGTLPLISNGPGIRIACLRLSFVSLSSHVSPYGPRLCFVPSCPINRRAVTPAPFESSCRIEAHS